MPRMTGAPVEQSALNNAVMLAILKATRTQCACEACALLRKACEAMEKALGAGI